MKSLYINNLKKTVYKGFDNVTVYSIHPDILMIFVKFILVSEPNNPSSMYLQKNNKMHNHSIM